ncbi:hypothetical protein Dimus_036008, partial [Dionaea muscipula]
MNGGKDGNPPTLETMYFETPKTKNKTFEEAAARKYCSLRARCRWLIYAAVIALVQAAHDDVVAGLAQAIIVAGFRLLVLAAHDVAGS